MTDRARIVVVDDHPLLRAGVVRSLEETGLYAVVGEGSSAADAIRLAESATPDLVLVDLSMPGGGLLAVRTIIERTPGVKVAVLTVSEADDDVLEALRAGAKGYILKGVGSAALSEIVQEILEGGSYVAPGLAARLLSELRIAGRSPSRPADERLADLTDREAEILRLVAEGLSNKEIGSRLTLQEKTVKHHMTRILDKLRVRNRTEAALVARGLGPRDPSV
jgi:DNA-binding NarL/FixJ family response regulator